MVKSNVLVVPSVSNRSTRWPDNNRARLPAPYKPRAKWNDVKRSVSGDVKSLISGLVQRYKNK